MSIQLMSRVWYSAVIHDSSTLLVMLAIAYLANDDGILWTDFSFIASKCLISKRKVHSIIKYLEQVGALHVACCLGRYSEKKYRFTVTL